MRRIFVLAAMAVSATAVAPAASSADGPVTIGQLAPANPTDLCGSGPADIIQGTLASGTSYTVPSDGTITQWSTNAGTGTGQTLKMKVFRPVSGTTYTVVAHDLEALMPSQLNTFSVNIPVKAGDVIGLNDQLTAPSACLFNTGLSGDAYRQDAIPTDAADRSQAAFTLGPTPPYRLNLTATVAPPPVTGQRAKALKKCKKRHSKRARRKCRKKANLLPV